MRAFGLVTDHMNRCGPLLSYYTVKDGVWQGGALVVSHRRPFQMVVADDAGDCRCVSLPLYPFILIIQWLAIRPVSITSTSLLSLAVLRLNRTPGHSAPDTVINPDLQLPRPSRYLHFLALYHRVASPTRRSFGQLSIEQRRRARLLCPCDRAKLALGSTQL